MPRIRPTAAGTREKGLAHPKPRRETGRPAVAAKPEPPPPKAEASVEPDLLQRMTALKVTRRLLEAGLLPKPSVKAQSSERGPELQAVLDAKGERVSAEFLFNRAVARAARAGLSRRDIAWAAGLPVSGLGDLLRRLERSMPQGWDL